MHSTDDFVALALPFCQQPTAVNVKQGFCDGRIGVGNLKHEQIIQKPAASARHSEPGGASDTGAIAAGFDDAANLLEQMTLTAGYGFAEETLEALRVVEQLRTAVLHHGGQPE